MLGIIWLNCLAVPFCNASFRMSFVKTIKQNSHGCIQMFHYLCCMAIAWVRPCLSNSAISYNAQDYEWHVCSVAMEENIWTTYKPRQDDEINDTSLWQVCRSWCRQVGNTRIIQLVYCFQSETSFIYDGICCSRHSLKQPSALVEQARCLQPAMFALTLNLSDHAWKCVETLGWDASTTCILL